MKFTFKTEKSTGAYRSFYPDYHYIKLKRKQVGTIGDLFPHKIRLMVTKEDIMEDGNKNCAWKWIALKHDSATLDEAKKFLNDNFEKLSEMYKLHPQED